MDRTLSTLKVLLYFLFITTIYALLEDNESPVESNATAKSKNTVTESTITNDLADVTIEPKSSSNDKTLVDIDKIVVKSDLTLNKTATITVKALRNSRIPEENIMSKFYKLVTDPIRAFLSAPKVITVFRNVGTCMVNGLVELISYYFPPPLIPLVASAVGMVIPFEPIVMLRDKMPVTSYRRAFLTAINTFMKSFNRYKIDDNSEEDPYMLRRFNRRMMNVRKESEEKVNNRSRYRFD